MTDDGKVEAHNDQNNNQLYKKLTTKADDHYDKL